MDALPVKKPAPPETTTAVAVLFVTLLLFVAHVMFAVRLLLALLLLLKMRLLWLLRLRLANAGPARTSGAQASMHWPSTAVAFSMIGAEQPSGDGSNPKYDTMRGDTEGVGDGDGSGGAL